VSLAWWNILYIMDCIVHGKNVLYMCVCVCIYITECWQNNIEFMPLSAVVDNTDVL